MLFGQNRNELRQMYVDAWEKAQSSQSLSPLEAQIAAVVGEHPEYHAALQEAVLDEAYTPGEGKTNPFLHMGLHLAVREQAAANRPAGIREVHQKLGAKTGDVHQAEHRMIECLAESLWEAQNRNLPPDEQAYLQRLQRLVG